MQVVARPLPLTYTVKALWAALDGGVSLTTALDLDVLMAFAVALSWLAVLMPARRVAT